MSESVRIGTRGSGLALRQAELVAEVLRGRWPGLRVTPVPITTSTARFVMSTSFGSPSALDVH